MSIKSFLLAVAILLIFIGMGVMNGKSFSRNDVKPNYDGSVLQQPDKLPEQPKEKPEQAKTTKKEIEIEVAKAIKEGKIVIHSREIIEIDGYFCALQFGSWNCVKLK